jgi:hypothetical protein
MDMDVHRPGADLAGGVPREGDQLAAGESSAGVAGEGGKELELPRSEVHGPSVMSKTASDDIEVEAVGHRQLRPTGERRLERVATGCWFDIDHRLIVERDG